MKTVFPGVRIELDDALILLMLETEGLTQKWEELKGALGGHSRFMMYDPLDKKERWIIQEFKGIPGDEGLHLTIVEERMLRHPVVLEMFAAIEKLQEITLDTPCLPMWHTPKRNQN